MHVLRVPAQALAPGGRSGAGVGRGGSRTVVLPLVVHRPRRILVHPFPPGITAHRNAGRPDHLIFGDVEVHQVAAELAVKFARWHQRGFLPAEPVVDHDLGIPLGEIEAAALAALPPGKGRRPGIPGHLDHHGVSRPQRRGEIEPHDRAVGRKGVRGLDRRTHDPHIARVIEGEVGVSQIVEPAPLLGRVDSGPARAGTKSIEMKVQ